MAGEFRVNASELNLRSEPTVRPGNRIALLPQGHRVTKIAEATNPDWWNVETTLDGAALAGFVAHRFLVPAGQFQEPPAVTGIAAVHLRKDNRHSKRANAFSRAFPLFEADQPGRKGTTANARRTELGKILEWLDVETSARYAPKNATTFCNIYAHDFCFLSGPYLPRVWWTRQAIARLSQGKPVAPLIGQTVNELNANAIFNWLVEFGSTFGWSRTFSLDDLQDASNEGGVGLICAQRIDPNRPGHIVAVVPETSSQKATRTNNKVTRPLQSQAGAENFRHRAGTPFWTQAKFRQFGFWTHE
jgi:hypothetical protein